MYKAVFKFPIPRKVEGEENYKVEGNFEEVNNAIYKEFPADVADHISELVCSDRFWELEFTVESITVRVTDIS